MAIHENIVRKIAKGSVSWEWSNKDQGLVKWTFSNTGTRTGSWVLMRGAGVPGGVSEPSYVFGTAFNVIYLANPEDFETSLATSLIPLYDAHARDFTGQGKDLPVPTMDTTPPMAYVQDSTGQGMIAFIFTLRPATEWSMLEGGFLDGVEPADPVLIEVTPGIVERFCWYWHATQCNGYNAQSGTSFPCPAEPLPITTLSFTCRKPLVPEFNNSFVRGICSTGNPTGSRCMDEIMRGIDNRDLLTVLSGISCLMNELQIKL